MKLFQSLSVHLMLLLSGLALLGGPVRGYTKKDGTYVAPHNRSAPDGSKANNWSTKGNLNPYTGAVGTKDVSGAPEGRYKPGPSQSPTQDPNDANGSVATTPSPVRQQPAPAEHGLSEETKNKVLEWQRQKANDGND